MKILRQQWYSRLVFFSVLKTGMGLVYTVQSKYSSLNLKPGTGNQNRTEWTNGTEKSSRIGKSVPYCILSQNIPTRRDEPFLPEFQRPC